LKKSQTEISGLFLPWAYAPTEDAKRMTYERIEDLNQERKAIEASVGEIKGRQVDNVVDLDGVFRLLRIFNKGFPDLPAHRHGPHPERR